MGKRSFGLRVRGIEYSRIIETLTTTTGRKSG
jgi:hypothetical protein